MRLEPFMTNSKLGLLGNLNISMKNCRENQMGWNIKWEYKKLGNGTKKIVMNNQIVDDRIRSR